MRLRQSAAVAGLVGAKYLLEDADDPLGRLSVLRYPIAGAEDARMRPSVPPAERSASAPPIAPDSESLTAAAPFPREPGWWDRQW
jgi:hypothetical protein